MLLGMRQGPFGDPSPVINWDFLQSQSLTSFSRTSNATLFDSTGKLTYAANNLLQRSQEFQTVWFRQGVDAFGSGSTADAAIAPDGTTTADLIKATAGAGRHQVIQSFAGTIGQRFVISVYVKAGTSAYPYVTSYDGGSTWATAVFDISSASTTASQTAAFQTTILGTSKQSVGNDWYRISIAFSWNTSFAPNIGIGFAAAATGNTINAPTAGLPEFTATGNETLYFWGAQAEAVTYQTTPSTYNPTTTSAYYGPRYPYAYNGTTWDAQGLLVEAAGTNLCQYSQDMRAVSGWNNNGVTVNINVSATLAPDGTQTANKIIEGAGTTLQAYRGFTVTTAAYTYSCFAKAAERSWLIVYAQDAATDPAAWFNLSNGTVGTQQAGVTASIQNVGGGWFRCCVTRVAASAGTGYFKVRPAIADNNGSNTGANDGVTGIYVWGAQVELGDQATSYIPNLATGTTTRNADTSLAFSAISLPTGLSFSRASNAMQYDAAGRLTYAPQNLALYSQDFTPVSVTAGRPWTADKISSTTTSAVNAPDGTQTAFKLAISNTASGAKSIDQTTTTDGTVIFSIYAKAAEINRIGIANTGSLTAKVFDLSAGTIHDIGGGTWGTFTSATAGNVGIQDVGGGWYRCWLKSSTGSRNDIYLIPNGTNERVFSTGSVGDGLYIWGSQSERVTYEDRPRAYTTATATTTSAYYGPRYDYDPLTRLPKGLLIEEGRTNSALNAFTSTNWTTGQSTKDSTIAGPDAVSGGAQTIKAVAGNTYHMLYSTATISVSANTDYTYSLYAKAGTSRYVCINVFGNSANHYISAVFDIGDTSLTARTEQSVGTSSGTIAGTKQEYLGNGWFRLSLTGKTSQTTVYLEAGIASSKTGNTFNSAGEVTFNAAGTETISLFGAQLEAGSFPTSYIPTPGIASGIRSADIATVTGANFSSFWNATEGTLYGEYYKSTSSHSSALRAGDGTTSNRIDVFYRPTNSNVCQAVSSGVTSANYDFTITLSAVAKQAMAYKVNDFNAAYNGTAYTTDTSGSVPTVTTLYVGSADDGAWLNGHLRKVKYWRARISNAKLQTETA